MSNSPSSKESIVSSGLRKRSNPLRFDGNEDEARKDYRPIRPSPLANRSNSQIILSDSDSTSSQAPVLKPDPAKLSFMQRKSTRSRGPVYSSDPINQQIIEGCQVRSQSPEWTADDGGSNRQDKRRNLSGAHESPIPSIRSVSEVKVSERDFGVGERTPSVAVATNPRRHASTGNVLPWRRDDPMTRLDKRHENITDPDDDELVNTIMKGWHNKR